MYFKSLNSYNIYFKLYIISLALEKMLCFGFCCMVKIQERPVGKEAWRQRGHVLFYIYV